MLCDKCKKNTDCMSSTVYYSEVPTGDSKKNYGDVNEKEMFLCKDCIVKKNKKDAFLLPLITIVFPILLNIVLVMLIGPGKLTQIVMYIVIILAALLFVFSIINLLRKSYLKINDSDVYNLAKETLKKELPASSSKSQYNFWPESPNQFKE